MGSPDCRGPVWPTNLNVRANWLNFFSNTFYPFQKKRNFLDSDSIKSYNEKVVGSYLVDPQKVGFNIRPNKRQNILIITKQIFSIKNLRLRTQRFITLLKFIAAADNITFISSPIAPFR